MPGLCSPQILKPISLPDFLPLQPDNYLFSLLPNPHHVSLLRTYLQPMLLKCLLPFPQDFLVFCRSNNDLPSSFILKNITKWLFFFFFLKLFMRWYQVYITTIVTQELFWYVLEMFYFKLQIFIIIESWSPAYSLPQQPDHPHTTSSLEYPHVSLPA